MSNGAQCCALEICCAPGSPKQRQALITEIMHGLQCTPDEAAKLADFINKEWDLAPKGTLTAFKAAIAQLVRTAVTS
jgi:hypothetical protein